jgi:hypothetical protein
MTTRSVQILQPNTTLRDRLGGRVPAFDAAALARAEAALKELSTQFQDWMDAEVVRLLGARDQVKAQGFADSTLEVLFGVAHDLKGLGTTYEYPIVTEIAGSLCRLTETPQARAFARSQPHLVDAHVDAIRAAVRSQIKTNDHPVGKALLTELTARIDAAIKA